MEIKITQTGVLAGRFDQSKIDIILTGKWILFKNYLKYSLMRLILIAIILSGCAFFQANGQAFEKLKLVNTEVPEKYKETDQMLYKSIQAGLFYKQTELYESLIGKVRSKEFQSFESKDDDGGIYYYEFEKDFEQEGFLEGLLWGGRKPSKDHPEEYIVKDNILIIWSFVAKSELKEISKKKILSTHK
jgi:hypothetical protein